MSDVEQAPDRIPAGGAASQSETADESHPPEARGALMIVLLYLAVLITFWGYMYSLLFRGS